MSQFIVRTLFLQNYFAPAREMAEQRRDQSDMNEFVRAMKRTELADQTLERELNAYNEKGYQIISVIPHPTDPNHPHDLLMTVILSE